MRIENLDLVLSQLTAAECNEATDELARSLGAGLAITRGVMAAFNDLNKRMPDPLGPSR